MLAPDLPGFGDSSKPFRSYNAEFYASWLAAFLDETGIERADIVGNSMGGRIAIELGLVAPERVNRLVLLAPSPAFIKHRQFTGLVKYLRPELAFVPLPLPHKRVVASTKQLFSKPERLPDAWYDAAADEFRRVFDSPSGRMSFFSAARQIYLEEPARPGSGTGSRRCSRRRCSCGASRTAWCRPSSRRGSNAPSPLRPRSCSPTAATSPSSNFPRRRTP